MLGTSCGLPWRRALPLRYPVNSELPSIFSTHAWLFCLGQLRQQSSDGAVLEHIVERKRMDDLASSIVDRRFQEQKVCIMLHCCGLVTNLWK